MAPLDLNATILTRAGSVDPRRRLVRRQGVEIPLTRLEAAVLAYLAARPNTDVSREELLRAIWRGVSTPTSRVVDLTVSRLRQKLGEPDPPEQLLTAHGVGYRFVPHDPEPAPTAIVPAEPRQLVRTARGVLDFDRRSFERPDGVAVPLSPIDTAILQRLARTVGCPVPLDDLASEIWGRGQHRHSAVTAIGRLRKKLERDPAHPEVLVTSPGAGVRLEGETAVRGGRTNLSPIGSSFVGDARIAALLDRVLGQPIVTLRGAGGIGKTRLARQLGARILATDPRAEVWFCDLASACEGQGIVETVARTIGIDPVGEDLVERLGRVLARRPPGSVLILDNYEHLTAFSSLVSTWAAAAPALRIWVTTRVALDLPGERCIDVEPLDEDAAVQLFTDRSTRSDTDSPAVRALVRRLDGLPLAIELAAARSHQLTPEGLLARIGERLDLLVRPARDNASHHTTLRSAFDWSWDLLDGDERRALARLSVLVSPFEPATSVALIDDRGDALLSQLVARSLVHREGADRVRMFEAIREYAGEKLVLSGERDLALTRRAALFLGRAERWVAALDGPETGVSHRRLRAMSDELLAVYRTASDADTAARAALVLAAAEELSGRTRLVADLLQGAIDRSPGPDHLWQLWWRLGLTSTFTDDQQARGYLEQALVHAEQHSLRARTIVRRQRALTEAALGAYGSAVEELDDVRAAFLSMGEQGWAARTLGNLAYLHIRSGRREKGSEVLVEALAEVRASGIVRCLPPLLLRAGALARQVCADAEARTYLTEGLALARSFDDLETELRTIQILATVDLNQGAFKAANAKFLELERRYHAAGLIQKTAVAVDRATLELERGNLDVAEPLLGGAEREQETLFSYQLRRANLAALRLLQGDPADALEILRPLDLRWDADHDLWIHANGYRALASALQGDVPDAVARLADVRVRYDRGQWGVARFLDLCDAVVDLARGADPSGAAADAVLAAGTVVTSDEGFPIERPQDANLVRRLLLRLVGRIGGRFDTSRYTK